MAQPQPYQGTPQAPYPPAPRQFRDVSLADPYARQRAAELLPALPPYHFVDERRPTGLYRFFSYETPVGISVGAIRAPMTTSGTLGESNPDFVSPVPGAAANTAGASLQAAAAALLAYLSASGVPSEHASDPQVATFQAAWNADPLAQTYSALSGDGEYEENTRDALASVVGNVAPAVNASPTPAHATFAIADLRALAVAAGFPDPDTAAAVAMAESHIAGSVPDQANPSATNIVTSPAAGNLPERSFGLWQINTLAHPQFSESQLLDPTYNAHAAFVVSQSGTVWTPWSTYNSGLYLHYMPNAPAAAPARAISGQSIATIAGVAIVGTLASLLVTTAWNTIGRRARHA